MSSGRMLVDAGRGTRAVGAVAGLVVVMALLGGADALGDAGVACVRDDGYVYHASSDLAGNFGSFTSLGDIGHYSRAIAMGDFDGDGDNDIVAGRYSTTGTSAYHYFENTGGGSSCSRGRAPASSNAPGWT